MKTQGLYRPKYKASDGTVRESRVWWCSYFVNGRRVRESTGEVLKKDAMNFLTDKRSRAAKGMAPKAGTHKVTLKELCNDVVRDYEINRRKSLASVQGRMRLHIDPFFGSRRASEVSTSLVNEYIRQRLNAGAARATVNRELAIIERAFTLGRRNERIMYVPHVSKLDESGNARQGFFEPHEFTALIARLPDYLKPVVEFSYFTGWRRSEIRNLRWTQVDFGHGRIRLEVGTTKNGRGREIPMTSDVRSILETQRHRCDQLQKDTEQIVPWVFFQTKKPLAGQPVGDYRKVWGRANFEAGLPVEIRYRLDVSGQPVTSEGTEEGAAHRRRVQSRQDAS